MFPDLLQIPLDETNITSDDDSILSDPNFLSQGDLLPRANTWADPYRLLMWGAVQSALSLPQFKGASIIAVSSSILRAMLQSRQPCI